MSLQARKLNLIEHLINIKDEKTITRIEKVLNKETAQTFTQDEIISRAKQSNLNYQNGQFKTQEQLELDSSHW